MRPSTTRPVPGGCRIQGRRGLYRVVCAECCTASGASSQSRAPTCERIRSWRRRPGAPNRASTRPNFATVTPRVPRDAAPAAQPRTGAADDAAKPIRVRTRQARRKAGSAAVRDHIAPWPGRAGRAGLAPTPHSPRHPSRRGVSKSPCPGRSGTIVIGSRSRLTRQAAPRPTHGAGAPGRSAASVGSSSARTADCAASVSGGEVSSALGRSARDRGARGRRRRLVAGRGW